MAKNGKKGIIAEFREFIMRGNVIDMAVGVIIAGAFGKITTSLVNDVFMPFVGGLIGDYDLSALNVVMIPATETAEAVVIKFGALLATIIDFLLIALCVFIIVKIFNTTRELAEKKLLHKKAEEPAPEAPKAPTTEELLGEILTEIKKQNKE
jgi:large conductance mechanosensitive channel